MHGATSQHESIVSPTGRGILSAHGRGRGWWLIVGVALGGAVLSLLFARLLRTQEQDLAKVQFQQDAGQRVEAIQLAMTERVNTVEALDAFYAGSSLVERGEFHAFTEPLLRNYKGIQVFGWALRVPASQRPAHERAVRNQIVVSVSSGFVPVPGILKGGYLRIGFLAALIGKEHVVRTAGVERRIEVNQVNAFGRNMFAQDRKIIPVE